MLELRHVVGDLSLQKKLKTLSAELFWGTEQEFIEAKLMKEKPSRKTRWSAICCGAQRQRR